MQKDKGCISYMLISYTLIFFLNRKTPKFQRLNGWDLPVGNDPLGM